MDGPLGIVHKTRDAQLVAKPLPSPPRDAQIMVVTFFEKSVTPMYPTE